MILVNQFRKVLLTPLLSAMIDMRFCTILLKGSLVPKTFFPQYNVTGSASCMYRAWSTVPLSKIGSDPASELFTLVLMLVSEPCVTNIFVGWKIQIFPWYSLHASFWNTKHFCCNRCFTFVVVRSVRILSGWPGDFESLVDPVSCCILHHCPVVRRDIAPFTSRKTFVGPSFFSNFKETSSF